ncbi:MAG: hypothetical protein M1814_002167 [Vezdaea aestivalis]|nr:MAG: hypothetical protein M1814_002167 [Vezdaea aestivalis]
MDSMPIQQSMSPPLLIPSIHPIKDRPSAAKRPKLGLQVTQLNSRFIGKSTNCSSLSANPSSPTVKNTFSNAYEPPLSAIASPTSVESSCFSPRSPIDDIFSPVDSTRRTSFSSINSSADFNLIQCPPYVQPCGPRSILRSSSKSGRALLTIKGLRRPVFPSIKKVTYALTLTEDIITTNYTKSHFELLCEEESPKIRSEGRVEPTQSKRPAAALLTSLKMNLPGSPQSTEDLTPAARKRKTREWKWTIGTEDAEVEDSQESMNNDTLES